jgi:excinuclease ABC subunit C
MTASVLDDLQGVGPARRKALLRHFGSVKKMREATVEDLAEVTGISGTLAQRIYDQLHQPAPQEDAR